MMFFPKDFHLLFLCLLIKHVTFVVCVFSHLSSQQKALLLAYAETESNVDGTVNGITQTKDGEQDFLNSSFIITFTILN